MIELQAATRTRLDAVLKRAFEKFPGKRVVGIRARPEWSESQVLKLGGRSVVVAACASPLAVREALVGHRDRSEPLVVLTDQSDAALGLDVMARFANRKLLSLDAWGVLKDAFGAHELDRRLGKVKWIAEALIDCAPDEGYPPVPTGVLDVGTAWRHLLARRFQLPPTPSLRDVLLWAEQPGRRELLTREPENVLDDLREHLREVVGWAVAPVLAAVQAGFGHRVIPIGLVCQVVAYEGSESEPELRDAFVRLEHFTGGAWRREEARAWGEEAERIARRRLETVPQEAYAWFESAETILGELKAKGFAYLSTLLPSGRDQQLERWGDRLASALKQQPVSAEDLDAEVQQLERHALLEAGEREAAHMALRLVRWLSERTGREVEEEGFAEAVASYEREGGFVDWARARIWDRGHKDPLRRAYATLLAEVAALRTEEDRRFGTLLADWTASGSSDALPIERVLEEVVAPLAAQAPTLLVVMDGMSQAVLRQLESDLYTQGWVRLKSAEPRLGGPAVAALPTVTEVSRASLLCGRLTSGDQQQEKSEFPAHVALLNVSKAKKPPVLFHKGDLSGRGSSGLADEVHQALADTKQQVVAVVINAVDDHLMKGDQVPVRWTTEQARPLDAVLTAARQSGRVVVLTADHGHVVDRGTDYAAHPDAKERFRPGDGAAPTELEVRLAGERVAERLGGAVIAPWSDRVRYSSGKRHGYHGGASPAEVVVPLAVLTGAQLRLEGWEETRQALPSWWERQVETPSAPSAPPPRKVAGPGPLFPEVEVSEDASGEESWWVALLASKAFASRLKSAGRRGPSKEEIQAVLEALEERGGTLTLPALGKKLGKPDFRVHGLLAAIRKVLNVDGYKVLSVEEGKVRIDPGLARVQFDLDE